MPQIRRDLHLSNQEYGWAVYAFLTAYSVSYILGGQLADRLGYRRLVAWSAAFWSLAGVAHAFIRGLGGLGIVRAALGLGEAAFYPAAMRGVSGWFPSKDRAKAVGLFLSALSLGTLLSAPLVAGITGRFGWRVSFVATGACGFLLLPPWLLLHRYIRRIYGTPDPAPVCELADQSSNAVALGDVLRTRKFLCMLAARSCSDAAWYFYLFWMPGYFQEVRGMPLAAVGRILWIPYLTAGVGALVGAWLSSALIHRGWTVDRGRKTIMAPSALLAAMGGYCVSHSGSHGTDGGHGGSSIRASSLVHQHPYLHLGDRAARSYRRALWLYGRCRHHDGSRGPVGDRSRGGRGRLPTGLHRGRAGILVRYAFYFFGGKDRADWHDHHGRRTGNRNGQGSCRSAPRLKPAHRRWWAASGIASAGGSARAVAHWIPVIFSRLKQLPVQPSIASHNPR